MMSKPFWFMILAVGHLKLANGIINLTTGEEYSDLQKRAGDSLNQFQVSMSPVRLESESLVNECDRVIKFCGFMIPQLQQERLQKLSQELQFAINTNNISSMEYHNEETRRELRNLLDEVQLIQGCILAIQQAKVVAPTQAHAMSDKLSRMLSAATGGDSKEADGLWRELQPDVQHWLNQELPSNSIITGLTR